MPRTGFEYEIPSLEISSLKVRRKSTARKIVRIETTSAGINQLGFGPGSNIAATSVQVNRRARGGLGEEMARRAAS